MLRSFPGIVEIRQDAHAEEQRAREMRARIEEIVVHVVAFFLSDASDSQSGRYSPFRSEGFTQTTIPMRAVRITMVLSTSPEMPLAISSSWLPKPLSAVALF